MKALVFYGRSIRGSVPDPLEHLEYTGRNVVAVWKDSHFQGPVGSAGEDPVAWAGFDLHHAGADVSEYGLFSVLGAEGVHETVTR